jgi:sterol O-acyltransferase
MNMTTSAELTMNGDDNILRPRAVKPMNPEVLRTLSEEGFLKANGSNENGRTTAETRSKLPPKL